MKRRFWTPPELQLLRDHYADSRTLDIAAALQRSERTVYAMARKLGLRKSQQYMREVHGPIAVAAGAATRIKPGQAPWNKGTHYVAGGRSAETRFKPGRAPQDARNYRPIGSLRVTRDGILERKVTDDHPVPARRWVAVTRLVWEAAHGPVPKGLSVAFRPGQHTTVEPEITLDRLELVTRAELMKRNSVHRHGPEIASLSQLRGALNRQINRRLRAAQQQQETA